MTESRKAISNYYYCKRNKENVETTFPQSIWSSFQYAFCDISKKVRGWYDVISFSIIYSYFLIPPPLQTIPYKFNFLPEWWPFQVPRQKTKPGIWTQYIRIPILATPSLTSWSLHRQADQVNSGWSDLWLCSWFVSVAIAVDSPFSLDGTWTNTNIALWHGKSFHCDVSGHPSLVCLS